MSDKQRRDYEEFLETDFSFEIPGLARFRVNAFNQNRGAGAVFRNIPSLVLTLDDLNAAETLDPELPTLAAARAETWLDLGELDLALDDGDPGTGSMRAGSDSDGTLSVVSAGPRGGDAPSVHRRSDVSKNPKDSLLG